MWLPVHGCALPLPKRSIQRCGVRQFGPKPTPLWVKCSDDTQLAWILLVGGPEAIAEFCLARHELSRCAVEKKYWMTFVHSAHRIYDHQAKREAIEQAQQPKPLTWEERRQILIQREEQRRAKFVLERSWDKPSTQRIDHQQPVRTR